jgi:hypothetical protein
MDIPAAFRDATVLDLQWSAAKALMILTALSFGLPHLTILRICGASSCMQCIEAFRQLPAHAFPQLQEWELLGLATWWHPSAGDLSVSIASRLLVLALEARQAHGHRLLVLRVPARLSAFSNEDLVGTVEYVS